MLAVYVTPPDGLVDASLEGLGELRQLTAELGGTFHTVKGDDPAEALLDFARGSTPARSSSAPRGAGGGRRSSRRGSDSGSSTTPATSTSTSSATS